MVVVVEVVVTSFLYLPLLSTMAVFELILMLIDLELAFEVDEDDDDDDDEDEEDEDDGGDTYRLDFIGENIVSSLSSLSSWLDFLYSRNDSMLSLGSSLLLLLV